MRSQAFDDSGPAPLGSHPERSEAESKDPAGVRAAGSLDFARDDRFCTARREVAIASLLSLFPPFKTVISGRKIDEVSLRWETAV